MWKGESQIHDENRGTECGRNKTGSTLCEEVDRFQMELNSRRHFPKWKLGGKGTQHQIYYKVGSIGSDHCGKCDQRLKRMKSNQGVRNMLHCSSAHLWHGYEAPSS